MNSGNEIVCIKFCASFTTQMHVVIYLFIRLLMINFIVIKWKVLSVYLKTGVSSKLFQETDYDELADLGCLFE